MDNTRLIQVVGILLSFLALLYQPVLQRLTTLGVLRSRDSLLNFHGLETPRVIANTAACEDLHYHKSSNLLFASCQDDAVQRRLWFPPLAVFKDPKSIKQGSLTVVDPTDFTAKKLKLSGFSGLFVTHGIDVLDSPTDPTTVYIFAVNHLPNPDHYEAADKDTAAPEKARSQIEIFSHKLGSATAEHVRSVRHPLIRTPNDILAINPSSFYVTNDHFYREGNLRGVEDVLNHQTAPWSDTVHVDITDKHQKDPTAGIRVTTAINSLHNNNGLGRASINRPNEVVVLDAAGGLVYRTSRDIDSTDHKLTLIEYIQMDITLDNPHYYDDAFATKENNASGYILPGLLRAADLMNDLEKGQMPTAVYHLRAGAVDDGDSHKKWEKRLIFQDDGRLLNSASGSSLIGIDPQHNGGKKEGWLFATGFASGAIVASKISL